MNRSYRLVVNENVLQQIALSKDKIVMVSIEHGNIMSVVLLTSCCVSMPYTMSFIFTHRAMTEWRSERTLFRD